jgi:N-acyl-D-aspartate/D-glutamate deacylase
MRVGSRDALIDLMEGIEDIPGAVLTEGIAWGEWESFPQYLDFLDRRRFSLDVAAQIPHGALRLYVMGDRGARNEDATAEDIREMAELTREAMKAGAVGLSSSRTQFHRSRRADLPPPGTYASSEEMTALATAMADSGRGVLEVIPSGSIGTGEGKLDEYSNPLAEAQFFAQISHRTGVPVTFSTAQVPSAPNYWRDVLRYTVEANQRGAKLRPQIASRGVTVLHGLTGHHLFMHRPAYKRIAHLELAERVAKMCEPACKQAILRDADDPMSVPDQVMNGLFRRSLGEPMLFPMGSPVDYEPAPETSISARIAASNADAESLLYDTLVEDGGDGGAHVTFICDASYTTQALSHWAKRRTRGPLMSVENVVAKLTSVNADLYGMKDRGRIAPGLRADINLINLDQLAVLPPYIVKDLPAGGSRLLQDASGYRATFVAGCMTRCNGEDTGQRPGRLLRSTRLS